MVEHRIIVSSVSLKIKKVLPCKYLPAAWLFPTPATIMMTTFLDKIAI